MITKLQKQNILINKLVESVLTERYISVFTPKDKLKYVDVVWDMMQSSYEPIGGFKTASSKQELINKTWLWKLVKRNSKVVAAQLYKNQLGRKSIAGGTDGSDEGKKAFRDLIIQDTSQKKSWGEFSGAAEHLIKKYGGAPIPVEQAIAILRSSGKEVISTSSDGFHYTRLISGNPYEKIMLGWLDAN